MDNKIFVKPSSPALVVRKMEHLNKEPLKAEGEWVENNTYWRRRLKFGEVVQANPAKQTAKKEGDK